MCHHIIYFYDIKRKGSSAIGEQSYVSLPPPPPKEVLKTKLNCKVKAQMDTNVPRDLA